MKIKYHYKMTWFFFGLLFCCSSFGETLLLKDLAGREVQFPRDPRKIVGIGPGALRLLVYLQAQDKVAGVEKMEKMSFRGRSYWIAHSELWDLPECGPGGPGGINHKPDPASIMMVNPQVIFVTCMDGPLADEAMKTSGIPFVILSYGEPGGSDEVLFESLKISGKILNREKRADDVIAYFESVRKDLDQRTRAISRKQRPSVYVGGIGHKGLFGIESTEKSFIPFSRVNAKNLCEDLETRIGNHLFLNREDLLRMNPDVIFIDGGGLNSVTEDFFKKPEYYFSFKAFSERAVHTLLPVNAYGTNLCTALADAYAVGKILYPAAFKDIDPEKKADEIYTFLVGKPVYESMKKDYGPLGAVVPFLKPEE